MKDSTEEVMAAVRKALGRTAALAAPPIPPEMDEPITRLVHSEIGLPELFAKIATENKIGVSMVHVEELAEQVIAFLHARKIKSLCLSVSKLLKQTGLVDSLKDAGFEVHTWEQITLDQLYDIDCGITDVWAAVSEIGALLIRSSPEHGRAISLVPPVHVAILEPKNFVPDLIDALQKMPKDQNDRFVFITGPSKTADIEMNLVTGVHGPGIVQVFILR